jgi:hypothetical protein
MKWGDRKHIAKLAGLSEYAVWRYFRKERKPDPVFMNKLIRSMKQLGIKETRHESKKIPRNRLDIYSELPYGALNHISKKVGCSISTVRRTIQGKRIDKEGIIKLAELEAAINIWKTKFCKYESEL